jgi:hypothetical protein
MSLIYLSALILALSAASHLEPQQSEPEILITELEESGFTTRESRFCNKGSCLSVRELINESKALTGIVIHNKRVNLVKYSEKIKDSYAISVLFDKKYKPRVVRIYFGLDKNCANPSPKRNFLSIIIDNKPKVEKYAFIECKLVEI